MGTTWGKICLTVTHFYLRSDIEVGGCDVGNDSIRGSEFLRSESNTRDGVSAGDDGIREAATEPVDDESVDTCVSSDDDLLAKEDEDRSRMLDLTLLGEDGSTEVCIFDLTEIKLPKTFDGIVGFVEEVLLRAYACLIRCQYSSMRQIVDRALVCVHLSPISDKLREYVLTLYDMRILEMVHSGCCHEDIRKILAMKYCMFRGARRHYNITQYIIQDMESSLTPEDLDKVKASMGDEMTLAMRQDNSFCSLNEFNQLRSKELSRWVKEEAEFEVANEKKKAAFFGKETVPKSYEIWLANESVEQRYSSITDCKNEGICKNCCRQTSSFG